MKKIILALGLLTTLGGLQPASADPVTLNCSVHAGDVYNGFIVRKVWLQEYAVPDVAISGIAYTEGAPLPADVKAADPNNFKVSIGRERKRPFAVIRIPAYVQGPDGQIKEVNSYTLTITEQPPAHNHTTERTTDVANSVLANGTWYKIGITQTGFYKIDPSLISSMGLTPANINPANIRVFGNGGAMLSEDNSAPRASDLTENATQVNDNGNGSFDNGESVVFYASGPTAWTADYTNQRFTHTNNLYSDTAYYFITFDQGPGLHVAAQTAPAGSNVTVTSYNYYNAHEVDLVNPAKLGKLWFGEQFYQQLGTTSQTFNFNLGNTISSLYCSVSFGCTSGTIGSTVTVALNSHAVGTGVFTVPTTGDNVMAYTNVAGTAACNSATAAVGITFSPADGNSAGFLDYIEINGRSPLSMSGDQMNFRDLQSIGAGNVANYQLQNASGSTTVWDVTNPQVPVAMSGTLSGSTYSFRQNADVLHEFAATNGTNLLSPKYIGTVANQNLHGTAQVDGIIVTNPAFTDQANELADYHRQHDNMRIVVATTTQVYNEFSSGQQDISAIRDFARMFYKRAGTDTTQMPSYMLLLGGASYDYKNRVTNNCNYVPVYESTYSLDDLSSFCTDDFYGFLDDNENIEDNNEYNTLDIGVGRLPARSVADATSMVNKIMNYRTAPTLGPWRISATFVADNSDYAGDHMADAETMAATVAAQGKDLYNEGKVYVDAIPNVSTPAGDRCPGANAAIDEGVFKGTFLINYNGHGNPGVWATERILTQDDFNAWSNAYMLPFMVTATCDFGQFDQPTFVSAAEQLVIRSGGGDIAILTTTQATFATYNRPLNAQYLTGQFTRNTDWSWNTFGNACRNGKNITYINSANAGELANFRKFCLLGDPMLMPDFPQYNVAIDSIIDAYTLEHTSNISALGGYNAYGTVHDNNGNLMSGFNGLLYVSIYDKPRLVNTIKGTGASFHVQDNVVYKGRVSVTNGKFSFSFITPRDISYYMGHGKISTYTTDGVSTDAAGADTSIIVGGFSDHPQYNSNPPVVHAYINDSLFLNGGITGSNTSLYVTLYDETGINVSGNDVGHDLVAVLDGNKDAPYILNDYYETAPNTYQRGYVAFPISGLADGRHSITVTAWDVNDNSGEGTVDFIVVDGQVMDIQNLGTYPNPFTYTTHFVFEHNHPGEELDAEINIYNTSGSHVKTIKETFTPSDSRTSEITWDGRDDNGGSLPSGVYIYRLDLSTADKGYRSSAYQKLVIVR